MDIGPYTYPERDWLVTKDGTVNYKDQPAVKADTGRWKAVPFIFASEFAERTAGLGIAYNIVSYLFYVKHIPLTESANMTTNFFGTSYIMTLLGGFIADTKLGRFWTIVSAGNIQMWGLLVLVVNAAMKEFNKCEGMACPQASGTNLFLIYLGLYMVACGTGGIKACVSAFGADQFEKEDPKENKHLPTYFNGFFFSIMMGGLVGATAVVYIQGKSWAWGFGALAMVMGLSLMILVTFGSLYRYKPPAGSPITAIIKVFVAAFKNRGRERPQDIGGFYDVIRGGNHVRVIQTNQFRMLDKAAIIPDGLSKGDLLAMSSWDLATVTEVEDVKMVIRMLPILATTWFFWTVTSQFATFAVTQSFTTNRSLAPHFVIPPASVSVFQIAAVLLTLVIYDRVFMPIARKFTGNVAGITPLQRIGAGLVMPIIAMIVAAVVEKKRLGMVHSTHMEKNPFAPLPGFSVFWLLPQYALMGIGEALTYPGELDFFYNESPEHMQSLGTSFALCTLAIGAYGSSAVVSIVNAATNGGGSHGWLRDNLNESRLDYFFWTLAALSLFNLFAFMVVSYFHRYKKTDANSLFTPMNSHNPSIRAPMNTSKIFNDMPADIKSQTF